MACGTFAQSHKDQCTSLAKVPQKFHCTVLCAIGWEQSQVNPWKGLHTTLLHIHYLHNWGVGRAWWLKRQTCDRKVASLNPSWIGRRIFFLRVKFLCWLLFSVGSTPVLLQWHIKDPGHSVKSGGGRVQICMHTCLTRWSWSTWCGLTMPSRHSGNQSGKQAHRQLIKEYLSTSHLGLLSQWCQKVRMSWSSLL